MTTGRYAVFGHPIGHSLSPAIHRAFGEQLGLAVDYRTIDAAPEAFADAIGVFFATGGRGANVTLPHKGAALALASRVSDAAQGAQAANVLTRQADGEVAAHNTDGAGLIRDLRERHAVTLTDARVLLLGAGGAARGAAGALLDAGAGALVITNRTPARATALADALHDPRRVGVISWPAADADEPPFDLIVNATAAGVLGETLALPKALVNPTTIAYDLAYGNAAAPFVQWAQQAGAAQALDGLGMLVEQAADAFALWHGYPPQTEPVYQAMRGLLQQAHLQHLDL